MTDEAQEASRIGRHAWMDGQNAEGGGCGKAFANALSMVAIPPCGTEPDLPANAISREGTRQAGERCQVVYAQGQRNG